MFSCFLKKIQVYAGGITIFFLFLDNLETYGTVRIIKTVSLAKLTDSVEIG